MTKTNGPESPPSIEPSEQGASPPGSPIDDPKNLGVLGQIMYFLGQLTAGQKNLENKVDGLSAQIESTNSEVSGAKLSLATLEERSGTIKTLGIAILVGIVMLLLRQCDTSIFVSPPAT